MKASSFSMITVMIFFGLPVLRATCPSQAGEGAIPKATANPNILALKQSDYNVHDSNVKCTWLIQAVHSHCVVKMSTQDFSPLGDPDCARSFLAAFDGNSTASEPLKKWCRKGHMIFSKGSTLTLSFETDDPSTRPQFLIEYEEVLPDNGTSGSHTQGIWQTLFAQLGMACGIITGFFCAVVLLPWGCNRLLDKLTSMMRGNNINLSPQGNRVALTGGVDLPSLYLCLQEGHGQTDPEGEGRNLTPLPTQHSRSGPSIFLVSPHPYKENPPTYAEAMAMNELPRAYANRGGEGTCARLNENEGGEDTCTRICIEQENADIWLLAEGESFPSGGEAIATTRL